MSPTYYRTLAARARGAAPRVADESERGTVQYIVRQLDAFVAGTRDEDPGLIIQRLEQILRKTQTEDTPCITG